MSIWPFRRRAKPPQPFDLEQGLYMQAVHGRAGDAIGVYTMGRELIGSVTIPADGPFYVAMFRPTPMVNTPDQAHSQGLSPEFTGTGGKDRTGE